MTARGGARIRSDLKREMAGRNVADITRGSDESRSVSTLLVPTLVFVGLVVAVVSSLGAPLIPTIASADHVSLSSAQWVLTAALLTGAGATAVMGRLADGSRPRDIILVTLSVVIIGSVLSAASTSFVVLVLGRALQGVGLGLLPVNMAVVRRCLPRPEATRAIATLSVSTAIGAGLGYPLTGLVVDLFNFRAAYWFGAAVVLAALLSAAVTYRRGPRRPRCTSTPWERSPWVWLSWGSRWFSARAAHGDGLRG